MAETNAAALCEAGRRDAQALTVTGRRPCSAAMRLTMDNPRPLPVSLCPGGR